MMQITLFRAMQWYLLMVSSNIISIKVSFWLIYKNAPNYFFPCKAMVSSNIIPINVNFVTIHETGSSSSKIIKKFPGKESLKHLSSISQAY